MIRFVRVDTEYVKALRNVDSRVQSNAPELGKDNKPYLGVLFEIADSVQYIVPLSSPKAKHHHMPNSSDFERVLSRGGRLLAVLNFNNMMPIKSSLYSVIDFSIDDNRFVLQAEYEYCRRNEDRLKRKAVNLYNRYVRGELSNQELARTCDFSALEGVLSGYSN